MKHKVGKEPEGGSKKPKEVGNESPLASMFQKQQTANDLQEAREAYLSIPMIDLNDLISRQWTK
jgi:hypothetical protein